MRILLPPSEAKLPGGRGASLAARGNRGPLGPAREALLAALALACIDDPERTAAALLLPPAVRDQALAANQRAAAAATMPALRRYSGVVYAGLDAATLSPVARRRAERELLVFSGLFGVVRGGEPVPDYRVPVAAALPGVGGLTAYWRPLLRTAVPDLLDDGLVVDLRSGDYAAMWRPPRELADRVVSVRVVSPTARGVAVISYNSKLAKGRIARALVDRLGELTDADEIAKMWFALGGADATVRSVAGAQQIELLESGATR